MTQGESQSNPNQPPQQTEQLRPKLQTEKSSPEMSQRRANTPIWAPQSEQREKPGRRSLFRS